MKPILSIVVPVYNVSQYVEKCIRSIFAQSLKINSYEVIIVNDGTKDDSLDICEKLQAEFPSFKIISQENRGLSGARNTGLRNAVGEYVWFIDSDDWIQENCLLDITNRLIAHRAEIFWLGHVVAFSEGLGKSYIPNNIPEVITGEEFFISHLNKLFFIWKFIYKRKFLIDNELFFFEGILYEDLEFTPRALLKSKICMTIPHAYYYYLVREGSIVTNVKSKNIEDRFFILDRLNSLKNEKNVSDTFKNEIDSVVIHSFLRTVKMCASARLTLPSSAADLHKNLHIDKNVSFTTKLDYTLMKLNLKLYYNVFKLVHIIYKKIR